MSTKLNHNNDVSEAKKLLRVLDIEKSRQFFQRFWKATFWVIFLGVPIFEQAGYSFSWFAKPQFWLPWINYFEGWYPVEFQLLSWLFSALVFLFVALSPRIIKGVWWGVEWAGWLMLAATLILTTWK